MDYFYEIRFKNVKADYKMHPEYISFTEYFKHLTPLAIDYDLITNNSD